MTILNLLDYFHSSINQIFIIFLSSFKHKLIEKYLDLQIKEVQTDMDGEFVNAKMKKHFEQHGITHRLTCAYTPKKNGSVERRHRTIVEMGRCFFAQSGVPYHFWPNFFSSTVFLMNRLPTPLLKNKTPYESLLNKQSDYTLLKTIGCACYSLLPKTKRHKLSAKAMKSVFLGYAMSYKGYRCRNMQTSKIMTTRDVIFDEESFPFFEKEGLKYVHNKENHKATSPTIELIYWMTTNTKKYTNN